MRRAVGPCAAFLTWVALTPTVGAHFLFVRIQPPAEGGRFGEVFFSDQADAGDPRFIQKIAGTRLWLQQKPGAFELLPIHTASDRLRTLLPSAGSFGIVGECTYGVLGGGKRPTFLLRHYPKAVTGAAEAIAALRPKNEIPFEIQMRRDGVELEFVALRRGKPIPGAKFDAVASDLKGHTLVADEQGRARWKPMRPGYYAVYTGQTLPEPGVHGGKKYDEIREFTTLAFAWPLEQEGADPEAVALFQEAVAARAAWKGFPGFSAEAVARIDGRTWKGTATISAKGDVELATEDESVTPWVREQLESMALHRIARPQGQPPVVRFADEDRTHPFGRLLTFAGGKFASSYRVKEKQLLVVNRHLGKTNMSITVLDNDKNAEGLFLPRSYTVQYWDAATGRLQRTETIQNRWTRLGAWDLPTQLTMTISSETGQAVRTLRLSGHQLADGK